MLRKSLTASIVNATAVIAASASAAISAAAAAEAYQKVWVDELVTWPDPPNETGKARRKRLKRERRMRREIQYGE